MLYAYFDGYFIEQDIKRDLAKQNYLFIHKKRKKKR